MMIARASKQPPRGSKKSVRKSGEEEKVLVPSLDHILVEGPSDRKFFGALARSYRRRRGLTIAQVADQCGLDSGNLSRIERGARKPPKGETFELLTKALGLENSSERVAFANAAAEDHMKIIFDGMDTRPESDIQPMSTLFEAIAKLCAIAGQDGIRRITIHSSSGVIVELPIVGSEGMRRAPTDSRAIRPRISGYIPHEQL